MKTDQTQLATARCRCFRTGVCLLTRHTSEDVGFLGRWRPQSVSAWDNARVQGCVINPSRAVPQQRCMYPEWAAYLLPVRRFPFLALMILPVFTTGTSCHNVQKPTAAGYVQLNDMPTSRACPDNPRERGHGQSFHSSHDAKTPRVLPMVAAR